MHVQNVYYTHFLPLHILSGMTSTSSLLLQPQDVSIYTFICHVIYTCRAFFIVRIHTCMFRMCIYSCSSPSSYFVWDDFYFITTFATTESTCKYLHLYLSCNVYTHVEIFSSSEYVCMCIYMYSSSSFSS